MPGAVLVRGQRLTLLAQATLLAACACIAPVTVATVVDTGQAQCCSAIVNDLPPQTNYGATMLRDGDPLGNWQQQMAVPDDPPASVEELLMLVDEVEAQGGPMNPELVQPLSGLAAAYIERNRTKEAIRALRRGIHLARLNDGLHTPSQIALLEQLIAAHVRAGQFALADKQESYLFRVRSYHEQHGTTEMLEATQRYAHWIRSAYLGDLDRQRFPRLVGLNDLYEGAIEDLEQSHGEDSRELLPYLKGRVELSYLISVYPGEQESGFRGTATEMGSFELAGDAQLRFWRMRDHNFRYGLQALQRQEKILASDADSTPIERAAAHIATADWYQWHRRYASAIRHYEEAWAMLEGVENGEAWLQRTLADPLELPRDTIFNPGVMPLGTANEAQISLRFDVSRHGEAKDIEILSPATEETQPAITRAYHYLRNVRFRPRLAEGSVVRAEDIQRNYQIRY